MLQTSHNDNQTYDVKVIRNQWHTATPISHCDFNYMSTSTVGRRERKLLCRLRPPMENAFRGRVAGVD